MKTEIIRSKHQDSWFVNRWRPACAWVYIFICIADFFIFPVLWSLLQASKSGSITTPWTPLTLQGGGLFHMSFGAILGVAAWSRGQEKQAIINTNTAAPVTQPPVQKQVSQISAPEETPIR